MLEDGYDWMGTEIAGALLPLIRKQEQLDLANGNLKRPSKNGDKSVFDEEAGDPRKISQGYVVVRKRDLD